MWAFTFAKVVILQVLINEIYGADLRCPDNTQIDVTFFLDYPYNFGPDSWNKALQFVADLIKQFKIGPNDARFAAFSFNQGAVTLYDLRRLTDYSSFEKALKTSGTKIDQPDNDQIFKTITGWNMFSNKETARKSALSVAVGITNGNSPQWNETISFLNSFDVKIVTLGIGSGASVPILTSQSWSPDDALMTASYESLPEVKDKTIQRICAEKGEKATTQQTTTQKTSTTLPPVQKSPCLVYYSTTSQVYTNKTNSDCFKLCSANRLCTGYTYNVGVSCEVKLMTGAPVNIDKDAMEINPYISCPIKPDGCLAYSYISYALTTYTNHKACFNSCVVNPKCIGYAHSKIKKRCGLYYLDKAATDTKTDKSTSSFIRCPMK